MSTDYTAAVPSELKWTREDSIREHIALARDPSASAQVRKEAHKHLLLLIGAIDEYRSAIPPSLDLINIARLIQWEIEDGRRYLPEGWPPYYELHVPPAPAPEPESKPERELPNWILRQGQRVVCGRRHNRALGKATKA